MHVTSSFLGLFGLTVKYEKAIVSYGLWKNCCEQCSVKRLKVVWLKQL